MESSARGSGRWPKPRRAHPRRKKEEGGYEFEGTEEVSTNSVVQMRAHSSLNLKAALARDGIPLAGQRPRAENCIERAVLVCDGGVIHGHHLPPTLQTAEVSGTLPRVALEGAVDGFERDLIVDALKTARANRARAARLRGWPRLRVATPFGPA